jgi:outer membrane protein
MHARRGLRALTLMKSCTSNIQRAVLCALILLVGTPALATTPNAKQIASYEQGTEIERVRLLMALAKSPEADQVTYLLKRYPLQGPYAKNRTQYLEGLVLKTKGNYTAAAKKFRTTLADDPKLTMVRAELAETLVILQQDDSALHHLRLLAAEAPDEQTSKSFRSFIDKIDGRRPYTMSGYVSFAPSTNMNSGSKHDKVCSPTLGMCFDTEQPKSGIGVAAGFNAGYSKRLGNDFMFVAAGGTDIRLYQDSHFNSFGFNQSAELRYLISKGYLGLGLVASQQLDNQNYHPSYFAYGPRVSGSFNLTPKDHLSLGLFHEWRDPLKPGTQVTTTSKFDASLTHAWDATLNASLFGGFDRIKTSNPLTSYKSISAGVSVYKELPLGITAKLVGQAAKSDYDAFNALAGVTRADTKLYSSITITKRDMDFHGFAPSVTYSFTDNLSNINTYENVSHAVDFRFTKDF